MDEDESGSSNASGNESDAMEDTLKSAEGFIG